MSSSRFIARTFLWFRRRLKWILIIVAALIIGYFIVDKSTEFDDSQYTLIQSHTHDTNYPKDKKSFIRSHRQPELVEESRNTPITVNEVCNQVFATENESELDLHDLYENVVASKKKRERKGRERKGTKEKLRVFILPFTHVDPGWLKTFEEYTVDTNKILDNMHSFMMKNEKMKFMWAEFVFFERWWSKQSEAVKKNVRELVKSERLELTSGSWVMTDEANAYFPVSVDNIIEGHQFIYREFGILPRVSWSNDPFGYSNSVPYLFAKAGINRTVINRIHHSIKGFLQGEKAIPFEWKQYFPHVSQSDSVLTQVLPYTHYDILNSCGPRSDVCCQFDFKRITHWSCPGPKPVDITSSNVKAKADLLVDQLKSMSSMYEAPVMLMMHGDDFRFDMIQEWHQHHDNFIPLFDEINKGNEVEISFGTFSDYFNQLESWYNKNKLSPSTVTGDFFPYMCALGDYWTGYYTTRPFYKKQGRQTHHLIRSADLLSSFAISSEGFNSTWAFATLTKARRSLLLFQHHDAITGTSKIPVMDNYSKLLHEASELAREVIEKTWQILTKRKDKVLEHSITYNKNIAKTLLNIDQNNKFVVSSFNSLSSHRHTVISLLVSTHQISVTSEKGKEIEAQIEPAIVDGKLSKDSYMLSFIATLFPLSSSSFSISFSSSSSTTKLATLSTTSNFTDKMKGEVPSIFTLSPSSSPSLSSSHLTTSHDPLNGMLTSISSTSSLGSIPLRLSHRVYSGSSGGAYLMRNRANPEPLNGESSFLVSSGPIQSSLHSWTQFTQNTLTIKNLPGDLSDHLHIRTRVDLTGQRNTELVMQIVGEEMGQSEMYADSVGLQLLKRDHYESLSTPANYYPMPTAAFIQNEKTRITVLSDVEHGVMKMEPSGIEIMIDRMLNQDDGKGLGSAPEGIPTDLKPVEMHFTIVPESRQSAHSKASHYSFHSLSSTIALQSLVYPPVLLGSSTDSHPILPPPHHSFPCDMQLLTIRQISDRRLMAIIFHNGIDCGVGIESMCSKGDYHKSLISLLHRLGSTNEVQVTQLNGVTTMSTISLSNLSQLPIPDPQNFGVYVLTI